ncbi:bifunctional tRNA (5-methylaminomethyl-2-thiouridine)(34)-methyltransferase MnmD/FAD-dependent 5-carboxymethylaminomethyl-2-thiouridine(34) oxidoreductase MnmC [Microbulbifer sp. MLAF003]|uniref:bifunctional tRNA (5-methylaminomethyl-2-thiouridine)(34)-methyltransferase MnmD/FAD-dependent 5-carboxymethylaminomethyl-2-thiouridine(34) oxidoreductase MnmC n=1 Tax=Microbulbifer sp. MLAF003 TaxID=3032582 RepID=UPI0024ACD5CC|nr:bifunctional tRNA (5-methylaminomethyl-2-thiouridine)(34)-methyltransferase MnmD/FAD-dependent 5-carboxymethylaminomethyl-2-thiouridine(34) oxidoreductase MnmC [Microbulbifer sp. MLAF003]WHI49918.1 bifunctional tRNA (5-methylaminomethyl-2-thiouridine)(34)-methyltransferase MnmD/FAD-dependent 5-carboxymethylaminomethyl-2-thiouridine(34) oxidoreductase MnmC [Microbulbifer sp. MLAF003]
MSEPSNKHADIDWREDGQPLSRAYDDIYFSTASGLEETRYVFLQQNSLTERWADLPENGTFTIGETGFGTGLNFLAAWELWQKIAPKSAHLHFISVEKFPLRPQDLSRALKLWPQLQPFCQQLISNYPPLLTEGVHRLQFGQVNLTLIIGEASEALSNLRLQQESRDRVVDAWFLDGFAPAKNPDMWTPQLFTAMATLSKPDATFATFTCAGLVKRGLRDAGFKLHKVPGFGRKREMLSGSLEELYSSGVSATPWHLPTAAPKRPQTAAIIGGGISGATIARALAERGVQVRVFERGDSPGSGGSGNNQGILYGKLSPKPGPNGDFNLHALMFAQRYYRQHCPQVAHFSGLLQLAQTEKEQLLQPQIAASLALYPGQMVARAVTSTEASELAGVRLPFSGLYFPDAGWLEPQKVCSALLEHKNIERRHTSNIDLLEHSGGSWLLQAGSEKIETDIVVLCGANDIRSFAPATALPLRPIRGQVSRALATAGSAKLKMALCGEGYITPAYEGRQSFGATFKLKETAIDLRDSEHRENLETLAGLLPGVAQEFSDQTLTGRAALRAATPDYLPLAGPLPKWDSLENTYSDLRKNRKLLIDKQASYQPGLYVMGGLGSRGFTYAPLTAEILTAWILGEPLPAKADLVKALHPARFAIRNLGKNRS